MSSILAYNKRRRRRREKSDQQRKRQKRKQQRTAETKGKENEANVELYRRKEMNT